MRALDTRRITGGKRLFGEPGPQRLLSYTLLTVAVVALLLHSFHFNHTCDDAYISFRYAKNFAGGHGLVFNVGEKPVEGYTNFLWLMLLAPFLKLGYNVVTAARVFGTLFAVGTMVLVFFLPRLWRSPSSFDLISPFFLAAHGGYALWAFGGLEVHFFTFLLMASVYLYLLERESNRPPVSSFLFFLLSLTRPEGLLFFSLTLAHRLLTLRRENTTVKRESLWILTYAIPFLIYFLWRLQYFGYPFPNTYYAKVGVGLDQFQRGLKYLSEFFITYGGFLWTLPLLLFLQKVRSELKYLFILMGSWLLYLIYVGGDSLVYYRMLVPILPVGYLLIQESLRSLWDLSRDRRVEGSAAQCYRRGLIGAIVLGLGVFATYRPSVSGFNWKYQQLDNYRVKAWEALGKAFKKHLPGETIIAMNCVGIVPFYSELKTIDRLGITNEHIAHAEVEWLGRGIAGHEKTDSDWVLSQKPDLILIRMGYPIEGPIPWDEMRALLERGGYPSDLDLLQHPRLWDMYRYAVIQISEDLLINCFVRRDWNYLSGYEQD